MNKRKAKDSRMGDGLFKYFSSSASKKNKTNSDDSTRPTSNLFSRKTFENFRIVPYNSIFTAQTVVTNGDCFFAAVAHQLQRPLSDARLIRMEIVDFIQANESHLTDGDSWETLLAATANRPEFTAKTLKGYLDYMSKDGTWADGIVIRATAMKYRRIIHVYHSPDGAPVQYRRELVNKEGDNYCEAEPVEHINLAFVNVNFGFGAHSGDLRDGSPDHFVSLVKRPDIPQNYSDIPDTQDSRQESQRHPLTSSGDTEDIHPLASSGDTEDISVSQRHPLTSSGDTEDIHPLASSGDTEHISVSQRHPPTSSGDTEDIHPLASSGDTEDISVSQRHPLTSSGEVRQGPTDRHQACRGFNDSWKQQYLFTVGCGGTPLCLVCGASVSAMKKFSIKRHFETNHPDINQKYPIDSLLRQDYIARKESTLNNQQSLFVKRDVTNKRSLYASYEIALLLARKKKAFTDAEEVIKPAFEIAARMLGDSKINNQLQDIALSNDTMTRRVKELAEDVTSQVSFHAAKCTFFSLAMDESTDAVDTAQVTIFIRAVSDNFDIIEELIGLQSLHGTTKGTDLFKALKECVENNKLDWAKLESICTDGAPALTGRHVGCVALLEQFLNRSVLKYHCIIHQESLCAKTLDLKLVIDVVVKCVNKIVAKALNRREFAQFLKDVADESEQLLMHCEVRWLSRGKMLSRFWALKDKVLQFLIEIDELHIERAYLVNNEWLNDLAFLVDITSHLNILNLKLQGSSKLFTEMCNDVTSFKMKLRLFAGQLAQRRMDNFEHLKERLSQNEVDTDGYARRVESLLDVFESRFSDFAAEEDNIALFTNPFAYPEDKLLQLEQNIQLELVDLKCNFVLKRYFAALPAVPTAGDMVTFWNMLPKTEFGHLRSFAQRYVCRFGSTYRCEQTFSAMKLIKNKNRTRLRDINLNALLILATTDLKPDINKLVSCHQAHKSH